MQTSQERRVGPWALGEQLGRGGNGTVWRATSSSDGIAEPVTVALGSPAAGPFHAHLEAVVYSSSNDTQLQLRTVDHTVLIPADRVEACRELLNLREAFELAQVEQAVGGDRELLRVLMTARLICANPVCRG